MRIRIVSGEGEGPGTVERYVGTGSDRAIKARLTRERCHGERWAYAVIYSHESQYGQDVGTDFETGEECDFPEVG